VWKIILWSGRSLGYIAGTALQIMRGNHFVDRFCCHRICMHATFISLLSVIVQLPPSQSKISVVYGYLNQHGHVNPPPWWNSLNSWRE
jgi:hypothetical protein